MTELSFAAAAALLVGAVYWKLRFKMLLPVEAAFSRERLDWREREEFSQELLEAHPLPETPEAMAEAVQFGADRFLARFGGVDVLVWTRRAAIGAFSGTDGDLTFRSGLLESVDSPELSLSPEFWDRSFTNNRGDSSVAFGAEQLPEIFRRGGYHYLEVFPWGTRDRIWGLIAALETGADGQFVKRHSQACRILAAYFSSMADRSARFWDLDRTRQRLQGGLDVTMQRLDETNLQLIQRAKEIKTLQEVTDIISDHPGQSDVLSAIVSIVAKSLEADLCAFLLFDESTGELVTQPGSYGVREDEGGAYRISVSNEASSSVRVFLEGRPFLTGDAQNDPRVITQYAKLWRCHSLLVVPLKVDGARIGVMRVGSFRKNFFTEDHARFVSVIAEEAAVLIESAVLSRRLSETNVELKRLYGMKDDFVSTVSHEFKTPLTSIQGFLAVLLAGDAGPLNEEQERFLKIIKISSDRLGLLVTDLLDLSKLEGGVAIELGPIDLSEAARSSLESQRLAAEGRSIALEFSAPSVLPAARGNAQWLGQVFDNLISNAIKFTRPGGAVRVSVADKGEGLMVCVADSGIGIPEKEQERVFEKFYRASNRDESPAPGTGLGLAICRQIIDRHGGRIWFESKLGQGTMFYFVVPTERSPVPAGPESEEDGRIP